MGISTQRRKGAVTQRTARLGKDGLFVFRSLHPCVLATWRFFKLLNVRDFVALARRYPRHGGIILAAQASWTVSGLIAALEWTLSETEEEDWVGRVRWLNEWR